MSATEANKRQLDRELDQLENQIAELRVLFEQYFIDLLPQPPDELRQKTTRMIRNLLRHPFKNSQNRFRLKTLINRYQIYATYWERILKQKEAGTYSRDLFKAEMRSKIKEDEQRERRSPEKGLKQLFNSYEAALKKSGADVSKINYEAFKKALAKQAEAVKKQAGLSSVNKLKFKVVVQQGKVVVKASL